ncbi:serine/threonine protein kinase [Nostoc sp. CENA543]|uniref:serine/threonine-protein kinase n=1 Tax=Nostoc sp. CENA543 TaxID=1869241 RepID=UPI000CA217FD|nr:serine/threonine-protein kinase [Nostoc sp. CENA543]AUT03342.1 serine/threonine protein kinase [Nostoc sp. CENA543]
MGKIIKGRYEIIQRLGQGGFGTTFLAKDIDIPGHPHCIVKQFTPLSNDPNTLIKAKELFEREAKTLKQLGNHDQIPRLLAHITENQESYIVQELIVGHDITEELPPKQKPLTENQVIKLLQEILEVLAFVHESKVIHRDLKPDNIRRRTSDQKIVLIDFGIVKEMDNTTLKTQSQRNPTVAGTRNYMPREQEKGKPQLSSDIYAVGIIGIQALTGLLPDELEEDSKTGQIIWRKHTNVSKKLGDILDKMVRYDFRQRYQSAGSALQAIQSLSSSGKTVTQHQTVNLKSSHPVKNHSNFIKFLPKTIGIIMSAGIVLIIAYIYMSQPKDLLTYENHEYGIKLKYPRDWQKEDVNNIITKEIVNFISPKQNNSDKFLEKITIRIEQYSGGLKSFQNETKQEIKKTLEAANILEEKNTQIGKNTVTQLVLTGKDNKTNLKIHKFLLVKGNQAYTITYTAKLGDYNSFIGEVQNMLTSLEIN